MRLCYGAFGGHDQPADEQGKLATLINEKGSKMLDRVHYSHLKNGDVKVEVSDHTGVVIDVTIIPKNEWIELRSKIMADIPKSEISVAFDYLTVLAVILETQ